MQPDSLHQLKNLANTADLRVRLIPIRMFLPSTGRFRSVLKTKLTITSTKIYTPLPPKKIQEEDTTDNNYSTLKLYNFSKHQGYYIFCCQYDTTLYSICNAYILLLISLHNKFRTPYRTKLGPENFIKHLKC